MVAISCMDGHCIENDYDVIAVAFLPSSMEVVKAYGQ